MKNSRRQKDFFSVKESLNNILDTLAQKISEYTEELDDDGYFNFDLNEIKVDGISFFITGYISYRIITSRGDWETPSHREREYADSDLEIYWNDGAMDDDLPLSRKEIDYISKRLEKLN